MASNEYCDRTPLHPWGGGGQQRQPTRRWRARALPPASDGLDGVLVFRRTAWNTIVKKAPYKDSFGELAVAFGAREPRPCLEHPPPSRHQWHAVARLAGVAGKTPHAARHAMGKHIMANTGTVAAVQQPLGHTHAADAVPYA